jgi:hypothetical protein
VSPATANRAQDRRHQRSDDHGADHRRGRVGHDAGRGDHGGEDEQHPEPAQLASGLAAVEEQLVAHPREVRMVDPQRHIPSFAVRSDRRLVASLCGAAGIRAQG